MVKVIATSASMVYKKKLAEFNRIVYAGEIFEVTEERFKVLSGDNKFGLVFVERYVENEKSATAAEPVVKTEPIVTEEQEPEIYVIEPGKEPVQVDSELKPIKKKKKSSKKTTE